MCPFIFIIAFLFSLFSCFFRLYSHTGFLLCTNFTVITPFPYFPFLLLSFIIPFLIFLPFLVIFYVSFPFFLLPRPPLLSFLIPSFYSLISFFFFLLISRNNFLSPPRDSPLTLISLLHLLFFPVLFLFSSGYSFSFSSPNLLPPLSSSYSLFCSCFQSAAVYFCFVFLCVPIFFSIFLNFSDSFLYFNNFFVFLFFLLYPVFPLFFYLFTPSHSFSSLPSLVFFLLLLSFVFLFILLYQLFLFCILPLLMQVSRAVS